MYSLTGDYQGNHNLCWNKQASVLVLYPIQVWDCCCTILGKEEMFPLKLGNVAAVLVGLLGSVLLILLVQI